MSGVLLPESNGLERLSLSFGPNVTLDNINSIGASEHGSTIGEVFVYDGMPDKADYLDIPASARDYGLFACARKAGFIPVVVDLRLNHSGDERIAADVNKIHKRAKELSGEIESSILQRPVVNDAGEETTVLTPSFVTVEYASRVIDHDPVEIYYHKLKAIGTSLVLHLTSTHQARTLEQIIEQDPNHIQDLYELGVRDFMLAGQDLDTLDEILPDDPSINIRVTGSGLENGSQESPHKRQVSFNDMVRHRRNPKIQLGSAIMGSEDLVRRLSFVRERILQVILGIDLS